MYTTTDKNGNHVLKTKEHTIIYHPDIEMVSVEDREQYLEKVKQTRTAGWEQNIKDNEIAQKLSQNKLDDIKKLFLCGRIDLKRAIKAIENQGDITSIMVDDPIEIGEKKCIQIYTDEWANDDMVFDVLKAKHGITTINMEEPQEVAIYEKEKERLRGMGKLLPGIPGI